MRVALLASSLLVACTATASAPSAHETTPTAPPAISSTYPVMYAVLDEAELARRTSAAQALSPEWQITLDSLGFLATASFGKPNDAPLPPAEQDAKALAFLEKQRAITGLDGPNVQKRSENDGPVYEQPTTAGTIARLFVSRATMRPKWRTAIYGHLWPVLPPEGRPMPDAELEAKMKVLDPTPDLTLKRGYRMTALSDTGPVELRDMVCAYHPVDEITDRQLRPRRPCIDVRTGDDLTAQLMGMSIASKNFVVVERKLRR